MNNGGTITVEMATNDCAIVELMIKDEGVGMDSTTLQNLFQPFTRQNQQGQDWALLS